MHTFVSYRGLRALLLLFGVFLLPTPLAAAPTFVNAHEPDLPDIARGVPKGGALRVFGLKLDQHGPVDLELERFTVFAPDAEILIQGGEPLQAPNNAYFRGRVGGLPNAIAVLTVPAAGTLRGVITNENGVWMLAGGAGKAARGLSSRKVLADELDSLPPFACGAEALTTVSLPSGDSAEPALLDPGTAQASELLAGVTHTARVAVETDYEYFAMFGGETAALDYMGDLFAYASTVYEREVNTNLVISFSRLWPGGAGSDPWTASSGTDTALYEFRDYWNANMTGQDRTIAHMLSGKSLGGGIAYVGVLCNRTYGYGVSAGLGGSFDIADPSVVWDLLVVSHEIGHNFNSSHTHDYCGVEDIADPVDLCYTSSSCGSAMGLPGLGSLSGGATVDKPGTIMSYCHQVSGGYSNISFVFGTEHAYGVAADRVPSVMQSHVLGRASAYPDCLVLVSDGPLLSVQIGGTGSGTVTSTPAGIDCGATCSAGFELDTTVELSPVTDSGSMFVGFGEDCDVNGFVLINDDKICTANFDSLCGNGQLDAGEACDGDQFTDSTECGGCIGTPTCTASCTVDTSSCYNGICELTENCGTCSQDCIGGSFGGGICGNGVCEAGNGEDCVSCPQDCDGVQSGKPSKRYCCGDGDGVNPVGCDDSRCGDCTGVGVSGGAYCCGDGDCEGPEGDLGCILDCGTPPPEPWCAVSGASCSRNEDCCSAKCLGKGGGLCR